MRRNWLILAVIAVILAAIGGGVAWYASVPHTAEAQFALAEKLEKHVRGDALTKSVKEIQPELAEAIEAYHRVGTKYGASPKAAEALKRIARLQEEIAKESIAAIPTLDELAKQYPDEPNAGFALMEQARLLKLAANELKADSKPEAGKKFHEALDKLETFRKDFANSSRADEALLEIGRIWQDGLESPLIHVIETFEKFLADYPKSAYEAEALFRLARAHEKAQEWEQALQRYSQLLEEYPGYEHAADAIYARGKILADKMNRHDEAAKDFEKMAQQFPNDPRNPTEEARGQRNQAAGEEGEKYAGSRYGGAVPFDTSGDKALPPAAQFECFTAQKLDAELYDLHVDFTPDQHRITVNGTLKLANKGEEKKDILLMLGPALSVSKLTVDGAVATYKHTAETWQIFLPTPFKKDAETTLAFTYTGQYADPKDITAMMAGPPKRSATTASSKPATESATAPATRPMKADAPLAMDIQMGLGEYGYALSGAAWYPITIIGDVFDAHVIMTTPAHSEAVTNGALVKRSPSTIAGTPGTFEFQTRSPVFGLYFAYGPYAVQDKQVGDIHYYTYLRPIHKDKHNDYVAVTDKILSFYGSLLGGFPYEKMAIIDTPLPPVLGGVGPASLMFVQSTMVDHPEVPENLLAHELAHQWFGNLIPINITDAHYNQWLSEGFASYCDALYTEHKDGPKALILHIQRYQQLFFQFAMSAPKGSAAIKDMFGPSSPLYRPVVYEKGAVVLHMLRKIMGDEKFFALLKEYVATCKNKLTTVDDFRHLASAVHGENLDWFFAQWIDQAVWVHWKVIAEVSDAPGAPPGSGSSSTKVTVTAPDTLVKMPADITLIGAKDERQVMKSNMLDARENAFTFATPFKPVKVIVDEDGWVLKRPGTDNIWPAEKAAAAAP